MLNEGDRFDFSQWKKPIIHVIDLAEYEKEIVANARSGGGCGACSCGCRWDVGCQTVLG